MNHPIDVDVKARDQHGSLHQIEIPLLANRDLLARLLYTWVDLYSRQLHSGEDYSTLTPTYAIWLLGEDRLPKQRPEFAHDFRRRDTLGRPLLDHGGIWLLELHKFHTE
jgi:predicted transposase/invertase (TIGR01784 family)